LIGKKKKGLEEARKCKDVGGIFGVERNMKSSNGGV
jgi:hypothetical protein